VWSKGTQGFLTLRVLTVEVLKTWHYHLSVTLDCLPLWLVLPCRSTFGSSDGRLERFQILVGPEVFAQHDFQVLSVPSDGVVVFLGAVRLGNEFVDQVDAIQGGRVMACGIDFEVFHDE